MVFGKKRKDKPIKKQDIDIDPEKFQRAENAWRELYFQTHGDIQTLEYVEVLKRENGSWTAESTANVENLVQTRQVERAKQKEQSNLIAVWEMAQRNKPDMKYPSLWNGRNGNPAALYDYVNVYDLALLEDYLKQLQQNPMHFHSQFHNGQVMEATQFLANSIETRKFGDSKTQLLNTMNDVKQKTEEFGKTVTKEVTAIATATASEPKQPPRPPRPDYAT